MLFPGLLNVYPHSNIISVRLRGKITNLNKNIKLLIIQQLAKIVIRTLSDINGHFIAPNHAPSTILPPNSPPKCCSNDVALSISRKPAIAYSDTAQLALSIDDLANVLQKKRDVGENFRMDEIELSVIVPCYNSRDFIAECLQSILPYLSNTVELIIVNDGSTDDSPDIIENTINNHKDKFITIIHQENAGLSAARNAGIKKAKGGYICFLDSDDFFHPDFWAEILPLIKDTSIDIVEFNAEQFDGDVSNIVEHINCSVFTGKTEITSLSMLSPAFKRSKWYPWARVYKSTLFRDFNIMFPVGRLYEDMSTVPTIYLNCKVIYGLNKSLVWYRYHKNSITQTFRQKDLIDLVYAAHCLSQLGRDNAQIKKALFPTAQRIFNLIKYTLVKNKGAKLPLSEQKALRQALLVFIDSFKMSRKIQILLLPLYINTIVRFRKK
ncbi:glycosyltransferase family 2 protein [Enterobacter bugandensis]|uniref:glycosyltransferase family 2 protein n=1 Tax=Enterobacter bugandensis TaxID=881260 RepID=UPI003076215F